MAAERTVLLEAALTMNPTNNNAPSTTIMKMAGTKRVVAFDRSVQVFPVVMPLSEMTPREFESCFLTDDDESRIQRNLIESVRAMRRGKAEDDDDEVCCFRGIEHLRSPAHLEQRKINRECNVRAVLSEQQRQRENERETNDIIEALADASRTTSMWARELAYANGASDAAFVRCNNRAASRSRGRALQRALNVLQVSEDDDQGKNDSSDDTTFINDTSRGNDTTFVEGTNAKGEPRRENRERRRRKRRPFL